MIGKPLDVATDETVRFASSNIPRGAMVLEIGCGSGDVAAAIQRLGYGITAIDPYRNSTSSGTGRKSSPGLMKRSVSKLYWRS